MHGTSHTAVLDHYANGRRALAVDFAGGSLIVVGFFVLVFADVMNLQSISEQWKRLKSYFQFVNRKHAKALEKRLEQQVNFHANRDSFSVGGVHQKVTPAAAPEWSTAGTFKKLASTAS